MIHDIAYKTLFELRVDEYTSSKLEVYVHSCMNLYIIEATELIIESINQSTTHFHNFVFSPLVFALAYCSSLPSALTSMS